MALGGLRRWLALLVLVTAAPAAGQQDTAVPGDTTAPQPRPIPPDSVPDRAYADQAWLAALSGRLPPDSTRARLDSTLDQLRGAFGPLEERTTAEQLEVMYLDDLADLAASWGQLQRRLTAWRDQTGVLTGRVESAHDTLTMLAERWRLTRAESWSDLPRPVRDQVTTVQQVVDSALRTTRSVRELLQSLEARGAQLDADVAARVEGVRAAESRARRALLRQDSPVLWQAFGAAGRDSVVDLTGVETPDRFEAATEYLLRHGGRLRLHVLLFLAAAVLLWFIGRRRSAWATSEFALHWPSDLLAHPVAAGWLLALALTRSIHPDAPRGVYGMGFLALVPALAILLRQLLGKRLRNPAYALLGLYAIRIVAETLEWHPAVARLVLLGLALAGVGVLGWFARLLTPGGAETAPEVRWRRVGQVLALLGGGLLGVAAFANLFGFVTLADLLVAATLASGLIALTLVALVDVVTGALLVVLFATPIGRLQVIKRHRALTTRRATGLVHVAGVMFWLSLALRQFRLTGLATGTLSTALTTSLDVGSWSFTAGDLLLFGFTLWLAVYVARGLRAVLRDDVLARMDLDRGVPDAVASIVYYVALALGLVFAVGAAGIDFGRLAIIAGALGVGIGFGLQAIVANFISGLVLLFERPIKSGDTVELEGLKGVVQRIGIRASTVRTFQGADVIVPNQDLVVSRVINWTLSDQTRRVDVPIGVAYGSDPEQVIAIIQEAAGAHPEVLERPDATVLFTGYGESSLDFELRLWTSTDRWIEVRSDVLVTIYRALAARGIEIPFPQRDLHLRSIDGQVGDALRLPRSP